MRAGWLVVAMAALGCRSAEQGSLRIDPALAALVSGDAVLLAGARMDALRATPIYKARVVGKPQPLLDAVADRLGVDLRRDVAELLIASDGKHALVMARGKFAPGNVEAKLVRKGARRTTYRGHALIGDERAVAAFFDAGIVVAGAPPAVQALIDRRNRGVRAASPLLDKVKAIPAGNQLWAVTSDASALAAELPATGNWAAVRKIVEMLGASTLAADLGSGLALRASGECRSEADARTLSDALRGLIGLARLTNPDDQPELLRAYDGIRVAQERQTVRLTAEIAQPLLDKLIARLEQSGLPGTPRSEPPRETPRRRAPQPATPGK